MEVKDFKRKDSLKELISDTLKEDVWIYYPQRYHKVGLADQFRIFGVVALVNEKKEYCLINMPVKIGFNYTEVSTNKINDIPYKILKVEKGTPLFKDKEYIATKNETYTLLDDWIINSNNIPFYVGYHDLIDVFLKNNELVGGDLASDIIGINTLISIIGRSQKSGDFYRLSNLNPDDLRWVGLSNKNESYKNLSSMLGGTYLSQGIDNALLIEEEDTSALSKMMGA